MDAWGGRGGRRGQDGQLEGTDNRTAEEERLEDFFIFWVLLNEPFHHQTQLANISFSGVGNFGSGVDPDEVAVEARLDKGFRQFCKIFG